MSWYPQSDSSFSENKVKDSQIFYARVKDIVLSNEQNLFKKLKGWADIGSIEFKPLYTTIDDGGTTSLIAHPLFTNIKQYPLKEEIVMIISAPSNQLNFNPNSNDFYYFPLPIGLWNSNHHNAFPDIPNYDYKPRELELGNTFKEGDIKNLYVDEGDVVIEGRFGNSIKFSSTTKKLYNKNSWSDGENEGKPITIIRNGQTNNNSDPWVPIYEDINNDDTSIYLTSDQEIPLEIACKNLQSFNITLSNSLNSSLQLPNSNKF